MGNTVKLAENTNYIIIDFSLPPLDSVGSLSSSGQQIFKSQIPSNNEMTLTSYDKLLPRYHLLVAYH